MSTRKYRRKLKHFLLSLALVPPLFVSYKVFEHFYGRWIFSDPTGAEIRSMFDTLHRRGNIHALAGDGQEVVIHSSERVAAIPGACLRATMSQGSRVTPSAIGVEFTCLVMVERDDANGLRTAVRRTAWRGNWGGPPPPRLEAEDLSRLSGDALAEAVRNLSER